MHETLNMSSAEIVHRRILHKPRVMFWDDIRNVPSDMYAQRRFRSACAFVQSDQNFTGSSLVTKERESQKKKNRIRKWVRMYVSGKTSLELKLQKNKEVNKTSIA